MRIALALIAVCSLTACGTGLEGAGFKGSDNRYDFDGDGLEDLAVGARRENQNTGAVYVFKGTPLPGDRGASQAELTLRGPGPFAFYGEAITGCDLDADGLGDLVVGGESLEVFFGATDFFERDHPGLRSDRDGLGRALGCGDLTGDGIADLVVLDDEGPALRVFAGGDAWRDALSIRADDAAVVIADEALWDATLDLGDIDGDGQLDLVVGAHRASDSAGEVRVYRGGALHEPWKVWSGAAGASFGRSVVATDLDSDGVHDVVVGSLAGEISIFRGGDPGSSADVVLPTPGMVADDPAWSAQVQRPWRHDLAVLDAAHGGLLQVRARLTTGELAAVFVADALSSEPRCVGVTSERTLQLASSVGALRVGDEVQLVMGAPGAPSSEQGRVLAFPPAALQVEDAALCSAAGMQHPVEDLAVVSLSGPRSFGESMGR